MISNSTKNCMMIVAIIINASLIVLIMIGKSVSNSYQSPHNLSNGIGNEIKRDKLIYYGKDLADSSTTIVSSCTVSKSITDPDSQIISDSQLDSYLAVPRGLRKFPVSIMNSIKRIGTSIKSVFQSVFSFLGSHITGKNKGVRDISSSTYTSISESDISASSNHKKKTISGSILETEESDHISNNRYISLLSPPKREMLEIAYGELMRRTKKRDMSSAGSGRERERERGPQTEEPDLRDSDTDLLSMAALTHWPLTKHLVYRYFASVGWAAKYYDKSVVEAVIDTVKWRVSTGIHTMKTEDLHNLLESGLIYSNRVDKKGRCVCV
mmetsp:Transcript_7799/g.7976  ORF Transcript_7799/g.7976 Transcript_7799/m.7976 type:complete len:325 (-) Transcript_7799:52-1026(-)